jgi:Nif-specific regulatory protein
MEKPDMDAASFATLARCLDGVTLARDMGRSLDAILEHLLTALAEIPGTGCLAVVLDDDGGRPCIRASRGDPDVGLILTGALDRQTDAARPRVLRRGAAPVLAQDDGSLEVARQDAAMLAAAVPVGNAVAGFFFADTLLGPESSVSEDLRLTALVARLIGRVVAVAGQAVAAEAEMTRELAFLRSKVSLRYQHVFSVGSSPALTALRGETDRAALSDDPVALVGETGTGRGVLARLIHELSKRAVHPLLVAPDPLDRNLAPHLFGSSAATGTFAGPGLLEEADGGSLILSDAHLLPPDIVARLVQFQKSGTFVRQGSNRERRADTRLLFKFPPQGPGQELAGARRMRIVAMPSLRQRREDIPALLEYFLALGEHRAGRRLGLTPKALKALETYDWPGNIREMEDLVARLALAAVEERIDIADIPPEILAEGERVPALPEDAAELRDMERQQVISALERHGWVQSRAARELGLTLRQIGYRIRKYGLNRDETEPETGEEQAPDARGPMQS